MALYNIGSAEDGSIGGFYSAVGGGADSIAAAPAGFPGTYAYRIDPVNGAPITEFYGFMSALTQPAKTDLLLIPLLYRFDADFDQAVSLTELIFTGGGGGFSRRIIQNNSEGLQIIDKDEDNIGSTANGYMNATTNYSLLWYTDVRGGENTRDILWVYKPGGALAPADTYTFDDNEPGNNADTIVDSGSGFGNFTSGDIITVSGSTSNDGDYTIVSVTAGTMTFADGVLTDEASGGPNITISRTARWYKAIDVRGHGDVGTLPITGFNLGTSIGKGLPTVGGPFWIKNVVVQTLNETPNDTPLGSIITRLKMADGVNSTADDDFDGGVGAANPSHLNVDEIPKDDATTYDEGDTQGDHQSYAIANADGGHTPLALQVIGSAAQIVFAQPNVTIQTYIYDGVDRDLSDGTRLVSSIWAGLPAASTYNDINGTSVEDVTFNDLEAGVKITSLSGSSTLSLTHLGLEYLVENPDIALPDDFFTTVGSLILPRRPMRHLLRR